MTSFTSLFCERDSATQNPTKDFNVSDWTDFTMSAYLLFNTSVIAVVLHNESAVLPDIQHRIQLLLGITYRKNLDYTHTTYIQENRQTNGINHHVNYLF